MNFFGNNDCTTVYYDVKNKRIISPTQIVFINYDFCPDCGEQTICDNQKFCCECGKNLGGEQNEKKS